MRFTSGTASTMVGEFTTLKGQMAGPDPAENGPFPDRVDALMQALTQS